MDSAEEILTATTLKAAGQSSGGKRQFNVLVDGRPSCAMFWGCHVPPEVQTVVCKYHGAALVEFIRSGGGLGRSSDRRSTDSKPLGIMDLALRLPPAASRWAEYLVSLRHLYEQTPKTTWCIDCEFRMLINPYSSVIFDLSIRTIDAHELLNTTVNYNGITMNDMLDVVRPYVARASISAEAVRHLIWCYKKSFQSNYKGTRCHGMSVIQIRHKILDLGYSPETHTLLAWGDSNVDLVLFERLLSGDDSIVVLKSQVSASINVFRVCKAMLPTDFYRHKLGFVHRILCPDSAVGQFHAASTDTLALCQIIKRIMECHGYLRL